MSSLFTVIDYFGVFDLDLQVNLVGIFSPPPPAPLAVALFVGRYFEHFHVNTKLNISISEGGLIVHVGN